MIVDQFQYFIHKPVTLSGCSGLAIAKKSVTQWIDHIIVYPLSLVLQKHFSVFPALLMLIILFMTESMESEHADEGAPDKDGSAKNRPSQLDSLTPATEG